MAEKEKQTVEIFLGKKWTYGLEIKCFPIWWENFTVEILWVLAPENIFRHLWLANLNTLFMKKREFSSHVVVSITY